MNTLDLDVVRNFVNQEITLFHESRIRTIKSLKLSHLIKKNPYLFRAKNATKASDLIEDTLNAFISSSEEKMFGDFLESLAIFIAQHTTNGQKSSSQGVDLEFNRDGYRYLVSIKSGANWGNSSQHRKLGEDLQNAMRVYRTGRQREPVDSILGICYGKTRTARDKRYGYLKLVGQNFWTFISGNKKLYQDIIEPIGFRAKEHNDTFQHNYGAVANRLTREFIEGYCDVSGAIDWFRLVEANSGNFDLTEHGIEIE